MGLEHLSDNMLQDYLDGKLIDNDDAIIKHLNDCPSCRQRLNEYRQVYTVLDTDDDFGLLPDFSSRVMSRIESVPAPVRPDLSWESVLFIVGLIGSMTAAYILVSKEKWLLIFNNISGIMHGISSKAIEPIMTLTARMNISPMLVCGAVLAIGAIAILDYLHRHRKAGPTSMCA